MSSTAPLLFSCSIDDGHPSDMKVLALLIRHSLPATFYVPIRNREGARVLAKSDLLELSQHMEIGSHTFDHTFLAPLDPAQARYQIVDGKRRLEDMLGRAVSGFCYPGGKYRQRHVEQVKAAGFAYARSTMNLCFDTGQRRFEIPTTLQFYPHERAVYLRNFARGGHWPARTAGLRLALAHSDWLMRLYALFDHAQKRGGVFHLWGHAKDIEELQAWRQLDRFFAHVASHVPPAQRLSNAQLAAHMMAQHGGLC